MRDGWSTFDQFLCEGLRNKNVAFPHEPLNFDNLLYRTRMGEAQHRCFETAIHENTFPLTMPFPSCRTPFSMPFSSCRTMFAKAVEFWAQHPYRQWHWQCCGTVQAHHSCRAASTIFLLCPSHFPSSKIEKVWRFEAYFVLMSGASACAITLGFGCV